MKYEHLTLRKVIEGDLCVYCGELADSVEHFPPQSVSYTGYTLPCCVECNYLVGDNHPLSFTDRVDYLQSQLKKKYRKLLSSPDWTLRELEDLSPHLRDRIISGLKQKTQIQNRLKWPVDRYLKQLGV